MVSIAVIDLLEMIDVENGDRQRRPGLGGAADLLIKPSRARRRFANPVSSSRFAIVSMRFSAVFSALFFSVNRICKRRTKTAIKMQRAKSPITTAPVIACPAGVEVGIVSLDPRIKMTATAPTAPKHQQMTSCACCYKAERAYGEEGGEWLEPDLGNQGASCPAR